FIQFDPAVQRVLRIDVDNPSRSTLIRQVDVNRDSHPTTQPNCGRDQCSVKVDDDSLAFARQSLSASTSSRRVKRCNWVRESKGWVQSLAKPATRHRFAAWGRARPGGEGG